MRSNRQLHCRASTELFVHYSYLRREFGYARRAKLFRTPSSKPTPPFATPTTISRHQSPANLSPTAIIHPFGHPGSQLLMPASSLLCVRLQTAAYTAYHYPSTVQNSTKTEERVLETMSDALASPCGREARLSHASLECTHILVRLPSPCRSCNTKLQSVAWRVTALKM